MTTEEATKVLALKKECNEFHEKVMYDINNLCNTMSNFREASVLSHIADRLDLFIKELNEF